MLAARVSSNRKDRILLCTRPDTAGCQIPRARNKHLSRADTVSNLTDLCSPGVNQVKEKNSYHFEFSILSLSTAVSDRLGQVAKYIQKKLNRRPTQHMYYFQKLGVQECQI